ncbi:Structural maintenance of chromosomes protein 5 [Cystobasidiomycetes sp. EMM_F5]
MSGRSVSRKSRAHDSNLEDVQRVNMSRDEVNNNKNSDSERDDDDDDAVQAELTTPNRRQQGRKAAASVASTPASRSRRDADPQSTGRSKKRRIEQDDRDNDDGEGDDARDAAPSSSQRGPNGTARTEVQVKLEAAAPKPRLLRDPKDNYVMGSIVRIKVHNFVTYGDMECRPGPYLNMIMAPNGTGKSSIAAAIAIGLGFSVKVMDRAKDLRSYVRDNCTEGFVELELKGKPGRSNVTIKRSLSSADNKSVFVLNGKHVTQSTVTDSVKDLHVNVNNLCSFLPQDRVASFAKMDASELLRETQRAADLTLLEQQADLAEQAKQMLNTDKDLEKHRTDLVSKERALAGMERDVKRHKEKRALEKEVTILEALHPFILYTKLKEQFDVVKRQRNQAKEVYDTMIDVNQPIRDQLDSAKEFVKAVEERRSQTAKYRNKVSSHLVKVHTKIKSGEDEVQALQSKVQELKENERLRKREIATLEAACERLAKLVQDVPTDEKMRELDKKIRGFKDQIAGVKESIVAIQGQAEGIKQQIDTSNTERKRVADRLNQLNSFQFRKDEQCQREDGNLWMATRWLRDYKERFHDTVFDPVRLVVGVKDRRHAKLAEAAINYTTMKTIVTFDNRDYQNLRAMFMSFPLGENRTRDLRVNLVELPPNKRTLADYPSPCSREELAQWGFDCFAIDLIEGPEPVLAYLCEAQQLHRVAVTFGDESRIQHERLRQPGAPFQKYVTPRHVTIVSFSKYGNKKAIVQDNQTKDPRIFGETADQTRIRDCTQQLTIIDETIEKLQQERNGLALREEEIRPLHEKYRQARQECLDARDAEAKILRDHEAAKLQLATKRGNLQRLKGMPTEDELRQRIAQQTATLTAKRLEAVKPMVTESQRLLRVSNLDAISCINLLQSQADQKALSEAVITANKDFKEAEDNLAAVKERFTVIKAQANQQYAEAEATKARLPAELEDDLNARLQDLGGITGEESSERIADLQGHLELIANVPAEIVQRYEDLKAEVVHLQDKLEHQAERVQRARDRIERLHGSWYPKLKKIVDKVGDNFSTAMNSLGCLGEVSISEHDDYAKWAVRIKVAFRDGEDLQDLTAHRQSGGERSLTTMMYLLSLLESSKVPFSLVDEINQGMDQRAERALHNHLVNVVCEKSVGGQYFLITPKLLTNLRYHKNMRILCINNSEYLPEKLPLQKMLARRLAQRTQNR